MTRFFAILGLLLTVFTAAPGDAQIALPTSGGESAPKAEKPLTPEAVREMVSRLSDAEVRDMLLTRLDAVAAEAAAQAEDTETGLVDFARQAVVGPFESVVDAIGRTPLLWSDQAKSFSVFFERLGADGAAFMGLVMALAIFAGLVVEMIFRRIVRGWVERDSGGSEGRTLRQSLIFLLKRFTTDIAAVIVFYQAANFIGPFIGFSLAPVVLNDPETANVAGSYIAGIWWWLIVVPRLAAAAVRFLNAPKRPEHRLIHADQATAEFMVRHTIIFAFLF
ncbi:MAG: hypothetical protein AAFP78_16750, partial [Pseudomonadota bacterium]